MLDAVELLLDEGSSLPEWVDAALKSLLKPILSGSRSVPGDPHSIEIVEVGLFPEDTVVALRGRAVDLARRLWDVGERVMSIGIFEGLTRKPINLSDQTERMLRGEVAEFVGWLEPRLEAATLREKKTAYDVLRMLRRVYQFEDEIDPLWLALNTDSDLSEMQLFTKDITEEAVDEHGAQEVDWGLLTERRVEAIEEVLLDPSRRPKDLWPLLLQTAEDVGDQFAQFLPDGFRVLASRDPAGALAAIDRMSRTGNPDGRLSRAAAREVRIADPAAFEMAAKAALRQGDFLNFRLLLGGPGSMPG